MTSTSTVTTTTTTTAPEKKKGILHEGGSGTCHVRAEAARRKIFLCGGELGSCPGGAGATRIGEMQDADAGRETACCTCGTIKEW